MATVPQKIDLPKKPKGCSVIPHPSPITIPTPFGIELKTITDLSKGIPNDCSIVHSLMLQLTPMLAGFSCVLKILGVLGKLSDFAKNPLGNAGGLLKALGDASDCIGLPINPKPWLDMIKAILQVILAFIGCLIQGFESIRNFKAGIDLDAEGGTPLLLNTLDCAKGNGDTSLASLLSAMEAIQPLMSIIQTITGIVPGLSDIVKLPTLSLTSGGDDPLQPIIEFHDALAELVDAIP
jgi:hypothetical protein